MEPQRLAGSEGQSSPQRLGHALAKPPMLAWPSPFALSPSAYAKERHAGRHRCALRHLFGGQAAGCPPQGRCSPRCLQVSRDRPCGRLRWAHRAGPGCRGSASQAVQPPGSLARASSGWEGCSGPVAAGAPAVEQQEHPPHGAAACWLTCASCGCRRSNPVLAKYGDESQFFDLNVRGGWGGC